MTRRCSHCSNNGHNSRTCPSRGGVKLFGVRLTDGSSIKKSASMGNLSSAHHHSPSSPSLNPGSPHDPFREAIHETEGYLSDDPNHASCSSNRRNDRKKGVPWTEEEHRLFLIGLQKLGKGDWRGIARNFVMSRSPTQVASHAQKYFIRQSNAPRRKRRSSLFDMVADSATDQPSVPEEQHFQSAAADNANSLPSLNLSLKAEQEPMDATASNEIAEQTEETLAYSSEYPTNVPPFFPAFLPLSFPLWRPNAALPDEEKDTEPPHHEVLKPIPTISKEPLNVDVGLSHLSLVETENGDMEPLPLSLKLPAVPSRQSAFHANVPVGDGAGLRKGKASAIQAV